MPHPLSAPGHAPDSLFRLHFETDAESDALLRVLAFALSLSLSPQRILAERDGDCLAAEIAFDRAGERPAQRLLARTSAIISVRRAWMTGYPEAGAARSEGLATSGASVA
jgi:hypothetical protein